MYLIVFKAVGQSAYNINNGVSCAMRTLCKITGKKFYEDKNIFACKCPNKTGDETTISRFFQNYPELIAYEKDLYDENEAADYYLHTIGGTTVNAGYGLVTRVCDNNYVTYSLIDDGKI